MKVRSIASTGVVALATMAALGGCGGGGGRGSTAVASTAATSSSSSIGVVGQGTVGVVATAATVTISRTDGPAAGTIYEVVDPTALRAAGAQDGQALSFEGRALPGRATTTPGLLALELDSFQLVAAPSSPSTPAPVTTFVLAPGALAGAVPPRQVQAPTPWASRHGMTAATYQAEVTALDAQGFRPVAVTAEGAGDEARLVGIWEKDGLPWSARHGMTEAEYQAEVTARSAQGFRVSSVDTYDASPVRYVATWVKDGLPWAARHDMTAAQYQTQFDTLTAAGLRPVWLSARGAGLSARFAAVFIKDGRPFAAVHERDDGGFAEALDDNATAGLRLVSVARYATLLGTRSAAAWVKDGRASLAFHGQTAAEYQLTTGHLRRDGYRPISAATFAGRFTSLWVRDATPSVFRATGDSGAGLAALDAAMKDYMQARGISAAALAVTKDGRLVHSRGYGWGPTSMTPIEPDARFRLASVSKPLTALGVLRLVELGKLRLDETLGDVFPELALTAAITGADARFRKITIRQLLQHRGGFDRDASGDPMFMDRQIAKDLGKPLPVTPGMVFAWVSRRKLDFDPGVKYAYSNVGYCILGRAIERVTGRTYEEFVREEVLDRAKAFGPRVGGARFTERLPGEVLYVSPSGNLSRDVLGSGQMVSNPYGGWNLATMDAHGGWVASAPDLCRVLVALDDPAHSPLLSKASIDAMWARPAGVPSGDTSYYGLGWSVSVSASGVRATHNGSLPGTWTFIERLPSGVTYAALFNQRSEGSLPASGPIQGTLRGALGKVTAWPSHDLFQ